MIQHPAIWRSVIAVPERTKRTGKKPYVLSCARLRIARLFSPDLSPPRYGTLICHRNEPILVLQKNHPLAILTRRTSGLWLSLPFSSGISGRDCLLNLVLTRSDSQSLPNTPISMYYLYYIPPSKTCQGVTTKKKREIILILPNVQKSALCF